MLPPKYDYIAPKEPVEPAPPTTAAGILFVSPLSANDRRLAVLSDIMREHPIRPYRTEDGSEIGLDYPTQWAHNNPEVFSLFCSIFWGPVLDVILADKWDSIKVMSSKRVGTSGPLAQNGSEELGKGAGSRFFEGCKPAKGTGGGDDELGGGDRGGDDEPGGNGVDGKKVEEDA